MTTNTQSQQSAHEIHYEPSDFQKFAYHLTPDPLSRYVRDRRLKKSVKILRRYFGEGLFSGSVLSVCGGVGGEGIFLRKAGFRDVTVSDFSENALKIAKKFDPNLKVRQINAESMDLEEKSYDYVFVQDGLHHLPRPALGLTEMLRVARRAIVVIEPYDGLVGKWIGTEWETTEGATNYVFRWNRKMVEQTVKSYLLKQFGYIQVSRLWDHSGLVYRIASRFPAPLRVGVAKGIYLALSPFSFLGNNMVAVVTKAG